MTTSPAWARSWPVGLTAAAVLLAGVGLAVVGWSLPADRAQLLEANRPVNPGATDPADTTAHNSPTVAHNPTDPAELAVANRIDEPEAGCAVHVSGNSGVTWQEAALPQPDGQACFAPDLAFGADGRLYIAYVTLEGLRNESAGAWVAVSDDGGGNFAEPTGVSDASAFQVSVAADPTDAGRVYVAWLEAGDTGDWGFAKDGNPIRASRSDDAGDSWNEPATINADGHERALAPVVDVGPAGDVAVAYLDLAGDAMDYHGEHEGRGGPAYDGHWTLALAHSSDGDTWQHTTVTDELAPIGRIVAFFAPRPALAITAEAMHVVFHDARRTPADVWLWTSPAAADGESDFGGPTLVNDTDADELSSQYLPQLAAAGDGRLDVVYYDRRDDPDDVFNHVSLQSAHEGEEFADALQLSDEAFDSRVGDGSDRNLPDLGSRLALTATPERAVAVWADTRAGSRASGKQDLAQAHIAFTDAPAWRPVLLLAGLAVALVGLALTAWWLRQRRAGPGWPPR